MTPRRRHLHSIPRDGAAEMPRQRGASERPDPDQLTPGEMHTLLAQFGRIARRPTQPVEPPPARKPRRPAPVTFRVRVDIDDVHPPIWRRLDLSSDLHLDRLHAVLQVAFGWTDSHLHAFTYGGRMHERCAERFLTTWDVAEGNVGVQESSVRLDELLSDPGDRLHYSYDFGDGWEHTLLLEAVLDRPGDAPPAECRQGRRAGPIEDCGGPWGYQELLDSGAVPTVVQRAFDAGAVTASLRELLR